MIHEVDWVVFVLVVICCVISFESKFPAKGAVLEGGEEGVQFGEMGALRGLLALDGFDDGGEFLLEGEWGEVGVKRLNVCLIKAGLIHSFFAPSSEMRSGCWSLEKMSHPYRVNQFAINAHS